MPLTTWATHVLQWVRTKGSEGASRSGTRKSTLSSDRGLQPAHVKLELLVIADQHAAVITFPGLVHTARHTMGVGSTRSQCGNRKRGQLPKVRLMTGVKS